MGPSQPARRFRYGVAMSLDGYIVGSLVTDLKTTPGKDIWLFGGGEVFRSMLAAGRGVKLGVCCGR